MKQITFPWKYYDDQFVTIDGVRVRYWDSGRGPLTVLLVHGFLCSVETWAHTIPPLALNHRVVAVDLPGYGRSEAPDIAYSYDYYVDFLIRFLDHLQLGAVVFMGHSMGGMIGTLFTIRHPGRVKELVLVAPSVGRYLSGEFRILTLPGIGEWLLRAPRDLNEVAKSLNSLVFDAYDWSAEMLKPFEEHWSRKDSRRAALRALRGLIRPIGTTQTFRRVEKEVNAGLPDVFQPTLLCWGAQDKTVRVAGAEVYRSAMPNLQYWEIDHCGHIPQMEHAAAFAERVGAFLEE